MVFKQLLCCTFLFAAVRASGDIVFLHYPSNIQFYGNQTMPQSIFRDVGSGLLGLSIKSQSSQPWDGVHLMSPFDVVNALVVITVEGIDTLNATEGYHFPLHCDQGEENTWVGLNTRLQNQSTDSLKIRMELEAGPNAFGQSAFGALKFVPMNYTHLKADNNADRVFIGEMQLLRAIATNIPSEKKFTQDRKTLIWLTIAGLTRLIQSHGKSSDAAMEAQTELIKVLDIVTKAFEQAYNGQVVVAAFTSCGDVARNDTISVHKRDAPNADVKKLIPAKKYSENYPVIFNLLLWFTVIFIFSLIAICVAIADMDPGRDSIIYRMTSNRMKKDN